MADLTEEITVVTEDNNNDTTKIVPVPKPQKEIGIDTNQALYQNIINATTASRIDFSQIEAFTSVSRNRETIYQLIDTMSEDSTIAAVLETYAEDTTEYNDQGRIVWVESSDANVSSYVNYLLKTLCIDKNIYKWAYSLCKYGDLYLRLYRKSEYNDVIFQPTYEKQRRLDECIDKSNGSELEESVRIKAYGKNDNYVHYLEMVPNPAEMFELTRFGKSAGYIQAKLPYGTSHVGDWQTAGYYRYKFQRNDVDIYAATEFVHACLEDNTSRTPEQVDIFLTDDNTKSDMYNNNGEIEETNVSNETSTSYTVKRGQSLLYSVYKAWRELMLLKNSILLNRVTKSSVVRVVSVEVGDMPKEMVGPHLQGVKSMVEQKSALNVGSNMNEYTNPGPIENNIYVPTHGGVGAINTSQIGGDVGDIKSLADLDYYTNQFFGALRVPKQYFSQTDDATGFNGGTSLSIISSRYAKMIKRLQNTLIQAITDAINLMCLDAGLENYVNKFQIRMQAPTTQEEKDRKDNTSSTVSLISDIMNLLADIDDTPQKLRILKALLKNALTDDDVIQLIQEEIDKLEKEQFENVETEMEVDDEDDMDAPIGFEDSQPVDTSEPMDLGSVEQTDLSQQSEPVSVETAEPSSVEEPTENRLPSPSELGIDMTAPEV